MNETKQGNMYEDAICRWKPNLDYIAGFFDGEGNVVIKISCDKKRKYKTFFGGRIQIVQTNEKLLEAIRAFLGYGYIRERQHKNKKWRRSYTLEIQNEEECRDFIDKMKNRTFRKQKQLLLLREFYNERRNRKNYHLYSKNDALKYIEIAEKMQLLNDRNRISKHLKEIKQDIINFDENAYIEGMKEMYK